MPQLRRRRNEREQERLLLLWGRIREIAGWSGKCGKIEKKSEKLVRVDRQNYTKGGG
jgi:hypothetical protein